jgi:hypothetical protein
MPPSVRASGCCHQCKHAATNRSAEFHLRVSSGAHVYSTPASSDALVRYDSRELGIPVMQSPASWRSVLGYSAPLLRLPSTYPSTAGGCPAVLQTSSTRRPHSCGRCKDFLELLLHCGIHGCHSCPQLRTLLAAAGCLQLLLQPAADLQVPQGFSLHQLQHAAQASATPNG